MMKTKVLILCTGNSCRSQMAEGYLRVFTNGAVDVLSAGVEAYGLNAKAVAVMAEDGVDIAQHTSKTIDQLPEKEFDFVITVCDHARESCPWLPARIKHIHRNFPDPQKFVGSEDHVMGQFREIRKMIRLFCEKIAPEIA